MLNQNLHTNHQHLLEYNLSRRNWGGRARRKFIYIVSMNFVKMRVIISIEYSWWSSYFIYRFMRTYGCIYLSLCNELPYWQVESPCRRFLGCFVSWDNDMFLLIKVSLLDDFVSIRQIYLGWDNNPFSLVIISIMFAFLCLTRYAFYPDVFKKWQTCKEMSITLNPPCGESGVEEGESWDPTWITYLYKIFNIFLLRTPLNSF